MEKSLFPELNEQSPTPPEADNQSESDLWLDRFREEAIKKGTANAIIEFSSMAREADEDKFAGMAGDEKARLQVSATIVYPNETEKSERLGLFLELAKKTSIPYALDWTIRECSALFVSTNDEENPYRGNGQAT